MSSSELLCEELLDDTYLGTAISESTSADYTAPTLSTTPTPDISADESGSTTEPPAKRPRYRANRRNFYLTYAQCPLPKEDILENLKKIAEIDKYLIAQELHQDGNKHIHAYIQFKKKQDFRNSRWADIEGFHPNDGGSVRNHNSLLRYCSKDEDFITNFYRKGPYQQLHAIKTVDEGLAILREQVPRDFYLYNKQLTTNLTSILRKQTKGSNPPAYSGDDFLVENLPLNKAVFLYGPSGLGKTQFAKSHFKNPLIVRDVNMLNDFDRFVHDGIVFDDFSVKHWPPETVIHLLDMEEDSFIRVLYGTCEIPKGTPRIFTHNNENPFYDPFGKMPPTLDQINAIKRRLRVFPVEISLFTPSETSDD